MDLFPIYCNNCFTKRINEDVLSFKLSRCHHIICGNCVPTSTDGGKRCPVCNRRFHGIAITRDMPHSIANLFADANNFLSIYRNISKFQNDQRIYYYQHFYKQQAQMANTKRQLKGYVKLEVQLSEQIEIEKKRIVDLRDYIAYYDRREEALLDNTSLSSSSISSTARRMCRPRTPSLSATDTTLTDIEGEQSDNSEHLKEFNRLLTLATPCKSPIPRSKRVTKIEHKAYELRDFDY